MLSSCAFWSFKHVFSNMWTSSRYMYVHLTQPESQVDFMITSIQCSKVALLHKKSLGQQSTNVIFQMLNKQQIVFTLLQVLPTWFLAPHAMNINRETSYLRSSSLMITEVLSPTLTRGIELFSITEKLSQGSDMVSSVMPTGIHCISDDCGWKRNSTETDW